MVNPTRLPLLDRLAFFSFLLFFVILAVAAIDRSCLDAADSAYMVSSRAIADGQIPYRDFLLAHPPLLFLIGVPLSLLDQGTLPFRIFSIVVVASLGVAVWRLAFRITANSGIAMLAGVLTLFAPLGLYFSKMFINDPLVSLLTALIFLLLFVRKRGALAAAGVLSIVAMLTKLTWLPLLVICAVYVLVFQRKQAWIYLSLALGGSLATGALLHLFTGGAFLGDILVSQAAKGYSLSNFADGLWRIWQMDWPLIVPGVVGVWFAARALKRRRQLSPGLRGRLFLLAGWLISGLVLLGTLPADGHDTNLFLLAEPVLAILAAWGIIGLAERGKLLAITAVAIWVAIAVPVLVDRDRDFLFRSNADDVKTVAAEIRQRSGEEQPVLAPGCYALEADRPVVLDFYDQFLWEEKLRRGDPEARELFERLKEEISGGKVPAAVFDQTQPLREFLSGSLEERYALDYVSGQWPPVELWVLKGKEDPAEFC